MAKNAFRTILIFAAALALMAVTASAQQDFSKIEVKTTKVSDNFYTLEGAGGMVGVLVGPDGVFMVDSQFAPMSEKLMAAIRKLTDKPVRFMVNTHVHGDHTGGNENFGKMGTTIIAREELRNRLMHPNPAANGQPTPPMPAIGLPLITYNGQMVLHMDGETIRLIAIPRAHTDGDTIAQFVNADVIMTGDFFRSIQYPNIDRANGGSLNGMIDGLGRVLGMAGPNTKIIPGHGPTANRDAVEAQRDIILMVRDRVKKLMSEGKSQEEVIAAHPTADLDAKVAEVGMTRDRFIGQVYQDLKAGM